MAENTKIQWTDATFNPWRGCTMVSDGCKNCYADAMSKRNPAVLGIWGKNGTRVVASEAQWKLPVKWNKEAEATGVRKRVFCASLADVFEGPESMPTGSWQQVSLARERLGKLIDDTPCLDWQLLTKRPENVLETILGDLWERKGFPPNVWIGTTVENQAEADKRIPELLKIPAKVRFLSCEPLLGPIEFSDVTRRSDAINWVIVGGESGGGARPCDIHWIESIVEQCKAVDVPCFVKQLGARPTWHVCDKKGGDIAEWPLDLRVRELPEVVNAS